MATETVNQTTRPKPRVVRDASAPSLGPFNESTVLQLLFRKALQHLSPDELKWLALDGSDYVEAVARRAAGVAEGVGCLIASDSSAGNFQSRHDVPSLLFHFAGVYRQIAGMAAVSGLASDDLRNGGAA
jgi:hypothetical protein